MATAFAPNMMLSITGPMADIADIVSFFGIVMGRLVNVDDAGQVYVHRPMSGS
jgi:hypothetical protein